MLTRARFLLILLLAPLLVGAARLQTGPLTAANAADLINPKDGSRTIVIVRHANKQDDGCATPLAPAGVERAKYLAKVLSRAQVDVVCYSDCKRTEETASFVVSDKGITKDKIDSFKYGNEPKDLIPSFTKYPPGSVVFVVAHSHQIPKVVQALSAKTLSDAEVAIDQSNYSSVFIITLPKGENQGRVVRTTYDPSDAPAK